MLPTNSNSLKTVPDNAIKRMCFSFAVATLLTLATALNGAAFAQTSTAPSPPPSIGEKTKGEPAFDENKPLDSNQAGNSRNKQKSAEDSVFGTAKVTESRRENGQRYLIELQHSSGSKQYIEELDSDGKIESTSNDIEETPNLPKWKIGSW